MQDNVQVLETLVQFLQANGNRQAILSETGGGNTASCETEYGYFNSLAQLDSETNITTAWAQNSPMSSLPSPRSLDSLSGLPVPSMTPMFSLSPQTLTVVISLSGLMLVRFLDTQIQLDSHPDPCSET